MKLSFFFRIYRHGDEVEWRTKISFKKKNVGLRYTGLEFFPSGASIVETIFSCDEYFFVRPWRVSRQIRALRNSRSNIDSTRETVAHFIRFRCNVRITTRVKGQKFSHFSNYPTNRPIRSRARIVVLSRRKRPWNDFDAFSQRPFSLYVQMSFVIFLSVINIYNA